MDVPAIRVFLVLSEQEHKALELIGEGLTNWEIAERMGFRGSRQHAAR